MLAIAVHRCGLPCDPQPPVVCAAWLAAGLAACTCPGHGVTCMSYHAFACSFGDRHHNMAALHPYAATQMWQQQLCLQRRFREKQKERLAARKDSLKVRRC